MPLERTPLSPEQLSPAAQHALASLAGRAMAARGLAPLPQPADVLAVMYQLSLDSDPAIRDAARGTAKDLPDAVLTAGLAHHDTDPRVLDQFSEWLAGRPAMIQRIILNPRAAGATITALAGRLGPVEVDLIAQNEQRLIAHPEIIGAMWGNRQARMSTVDRAVELAARHGLEVPHIPSWHAVAAAAMRVADKPDAADAHQMDELFANVMGESSGEVEEVEEAKEAEEAEEGAQAPPTRGRIPNFAAMTIPQKIRLATLGNKFARSTLIRDANKTVAGAAIRAPGVTENEAAKYASNQTLVDDVIKYIAGRRDWTRSYGTKLALIQNPKTSIPDAIRFMPHLRENDLRVISRSRGVPSAVVAQARKLLMSRTSKKN